MKLELRATWWMGSLVCACASPPPETPSPPSPRAFRADVNPAIASSAAPASSATPPSSASAAARRPPPPEREFEGVKDPWCLKLWNDTRSLEKQVAETWPEGNLPPPALPKGIGVCSWGMRSVWALRYAATAIKPGVSFTACVEVAREDAINDHVTSAPLPTVLGQQEPCPNFRYDERSEQTWSEVAMIDLDHDDEPELVVTRSGRLDLYPDVAGGDVVWTFKSGKLQPLAALGGAGVLHVEDVDKDGLVDVVTFDPYRAYGITPNVGMPSFAGWVGPELLLHGTKGGGFSRTDAAAVAYARKGCPQRPTALANAGDIACAHLWGMSAAAMKKLLDDEAKDLPPPIGRDEQAMAQGLKNRRSLVAKWTKKTPVPRL